MLGKKRGINHIRGDAVVAISSILDQKRRGSNHRGRGEDKESSGKIRKEDHWLASSLGSMEVVGHWVECTTALNTTDTLQKSKMLRNKGGER